MDSYDNYDNLIERWFKKKYPNNSFFDDEIMIDFLKTHQVKYLFASANYKFSNKVQEHLKLVSCDKETGGCFYRVNY
jgi:NMD protein affecting ribosome stability and mRNA decay